MAKHTAAWWRNEINELRAQSYGGLDNRTAHAIAREMYLEAQNEYSKAAQNAQIELQIFVEMLDESRYGKKNPLSRVKVNSRSTAPGHLPPTKRLKERRKKTDAQEMPGIWANPLMRVTVTSPSQRKRKGIEGPTHSPSGRLRARRKTTNKAPVGFFANPVENDSPGDFSHSSGKALGRAWSEAETAKGKDFGDCYQVRLTWDDGEWVTMLFDSQAAAMKTLRPRGFVAK